jgi:hypothetical protein
MLGGMQFCHHVSLCPATINAALSFRAKRGIWVFACAPETLVVEAETWIPRFARDDRLING